jgi:glycine C-acetyltransferase/8-amino-7-oxononanoate synthase
MSVFDFVGKELDELRREGLFRTLMTIEEAKGSRVKIRGKELINFCSNNYLGLSKHPKVIDRSIEIFKKYGSGAGASRLVSGNFKIHEDLEKKIAGYEGTPSAIIFPTGYMANLGTIQALAGEGDAVIVDRLDHASIIDGARLSGAKLMVYPHKDIKALEKILGISKSFKKRLIVTDHVFSMDGDIAPVKELSGLASKFDAMLMLDVAHSVNKLKMNENIIIMGTMSKTLGALGGYVAGSKELIEYLRNKARAFIYTTALPPAVAAAAVAAIEVIESEQGLIGKLAENAGYAKQKIQALGFDVLGSETQIIPIMIGEAKKAVEISEYLFDNGILLSAIRPPTVPKGTSRLRLTVTAMHSKADIDHLISKLAEVKEKYLG